MKRLVLLALFAGSIALVAAGLSLGASDRRSRPSLDPKTLSEPIRALEAAIGLEESAADQLKKKQPDSVSVETDLSHAARALAAAQKGLESVDLSSADAPVLSDIARAEKTDQTLDSAAIQGYRDNTANVKAIEKAVVLKKRALLALEDLVGAAPTSSVPCTAGYPPPITVGESTISLVCTVPLTDVRITLPSPPTKVSPYAAESSTTFHTGACSLGGSSLECKLSEPLLPGVKLVVAFAPTLKPGEKLGLTLTPRSGAAIDEQVVAPAGPRLTVRGTATENKGSGAAHTSFTFHVTIAGGPFQNVFIVLPAGNNLLYGQASTGGLACGSQRAADGTQRLICTPPVGHSTEPPGRYDFGGTFRVAVPPGTVLHGFVTGTGVAAPTTFAVKP